MKKISIKREQSQAGLSFAEREKFRPQVKNKLLLLLALLLTAATGAWADETPLLTIDSTDYPDFKSGSMTFDDKVTVTFSNKVYNDGDNLGWYAPSKASLLTVAGINGYTITSCKFYTDEGIAMTGYTVEGESPSVYLSQGFVYTDDSKSVNLGSAGVMKIEVYGGVAPAGYTVSLKDGVKDADKWTISPNPAPEGSPVTIQYTGRLKVKGVTATSEATPAAPAAKTVDLSKLTENTELKDGDVLTGTLAGNYKISIADGATVTLDGVTINGVSDTDCEWAGITCLGDATIILSGTNTVTGFYEDYPGIQAAAGKTLIINGTGSLTASSYGYGAGIGGANSVACGNIEIQGGTITATSGDRGAGIGGGDRADCGNITISGGTVNATGGARGAGIGGGRRGSDNGSCGNILISGGTVTATGGENAAGIGGGRGYNSGYLSSCGTITITSGVTKVTATMGDGAPYSIGAGKYGTCGTVTIGGVEGAITTSPYTYDPAAQAKPAATVTTAPTGAAIVGVGKSTALVSGGVADGGTMMYAVTTTNTKPTSTAGFSDAVPTAKDITASGKVYVWYYVKGDDTHSDSEISATGIEVTIASPYTMAAAATSADKGKLICADGHIHANGADAACTKARVAKIIYIGTTGHATYTHGLALALTDEGHMTWESAKTACNTTKNTSTPVTDATWLLASKEQWNYMLGASGAGSYTALRDGFSGISGASNLQSYYYWSSTEDEYDFVWQYYFKNGSWDSDYFDDDRPWVRACLAF